MKFDHKRKNHAARYLLNNWVQYEKNIDELRPHELENAKIFFSGLQMLTQEEQIFLASKYRTPIGLRMTDNYIALNKGMYLETYKQRKAECETALQNAIMKYCEENKDLADEVIAATRYTKEMLANDRQLRNALKRYCTENDIWPDKYKYLWAK
jgi:hypothetical protein